MKAVVLVGGEGTRLRPLTCGTPKPMVPVVNRPFLVHTFERLKRHNVDEVILAAHYLPDQIKRYFGDGRGLGITLTYSLEESPLGTAGAVKNAEAFLDGTFFVLNGDVLSDLDFTQLLAYHREREAIATLALMPAEDPTSFGVVETSPRGKVRRFLEKPSWESVTTNMVNGGCYVLEPAVLGEMEPGAFCSFEHSVFSRLLQKNLPVYGFPTQGYWLDIGTPAAYLKLNLDGLRGKFAIVLPGHKVSEGVWAGENCRIHRTARITGPVVMGDNCTVGPQARVEGPVVMGSGCAIEESAVVEESVLWDTVHVGGRSTVSHSILGTEASIGAGVWVIEGSVVGDRVVVGDSNRIERGMAVWPDRTLEPSTISFVRPS